MMDFGLEVGRMRLLCEGAVMRMKFVFFVVSWLIFALSWVNPPWPQEQVLHSVPAALGLVALWYVDKKTRFSVRAFALVCVFVALHNFGAHYLYSNVPYEPWFQACCGFTLANTLGWERNHFDRLVHFSFGLCFAPALLEWLQKRFENKVLNRSAAFWLSVLLVMAISLVYEWVEWGIALTLSPEEAESYNGQQGDMWDAHADMLLATVGALLWWRPCIGQNRAE
jgi:putative membrane protein